MEIFSGPLAEVRESLPHGHPRCQLLKHIGDCDPYAADVWLPLRVPGAIVIRKLSDVNNIAELSVGYAAERSASGAAVGRRLQLAWRGLLRDAAALSAAPLLEKRLALVSTSFMPLAAD
jgi:hypothetical protein